MPTNCPKTDANSMNKVLTICGPHKTATYFCFDSVWELDLSRNSFRSLPCCFTSSQSPPRSTKSSNWFNGFWQCNTDPGEALCPSERWRKTKKALYNKPKNVPRDLPVGTTTRGKGNVQKQIWSWIGSDERKYLHNSKIDDLLIKTVHVWRRLWTINNSKIILLNTKTCEAFFLILGIFSMK